MRPQTGRYRLLAGAGLALAIAACAQITGVSRYDDCSGDTCEAGAEDADSGDGDALEPDAPDSRTCGTVDFGTDACGACLTTKCAKFTEACRCNATCSAEAPCFITAFREKTGCSTCSKTSLAMTALLDCASMACLPMCSCR